jgi:hypothetical protein
MKKKISSSFIGLLIIKYIISMGFNSRQATPLGNDEFRAPLTPYLFLSKKARDGS